MKINRLIADSNLFYSEKRGRNLTRPLVLPPLPQLPQPAQKLAQNLCGQPGFRCFTAVRRAIFSQFGVVAVYYRHRHNTCARVIICKPFEDAHPHDMLSTQLSRQRFRRIAPRPSSCNCSERSSAESPTNCVSMMLA